MSQNISSREEEELDYKVTINNNEDQDLNDDNFEEGVIIDEMFEDGQLDEDNEIEKLLGLFFYNSEEVDEDADFRQKTVKQINSRDKEYTDLLSHFVKLTKTRNIIKEFYKWVFLTVVIVVLFNLNFARKLH